MQRRPVQHEQLFDIPRRRNTHRTTTEKNVLNNVALSDWRRATVKELDNELTRNKEEDNQAGTLSPALDRGSLITDVS